MGMKRCPTCGGMGVIPQANSSGMMGSSPTCFNCGGSGQIYDNAPTSTAAGGRRTGGGGGRRTQPAQPAFPWVDRLIERIPRWAHGVGAFVTLALGYTYGVMQGYQGSELVLPSLLGLIAWPVGLGMLTVAVKGVLFALILAAIGIGLYVLYWIWTWVLG